MIIELLLNIVNVLLDLIISMLPDIPSLPDNFITNFETIINVFSSSINLFYFFIRKETVLTLIPISIAIMNFETIWNGIIFILKKIPFLNIK